MASKDVNLTSMRHFNNATRFALKGEEKKRYVEQHAVLQRVPASHKLWIIAKPNPLCAARKRMTFWLQVSRPTANLTIVSLHPLPRTHARSFTGSPVRPSPTAPARFFQS